MGIAWEEGRKFTALESELSCEYKTIQHAIDPSMVLHNHDGHEILLVLSGKLNFFTEFGGVRLERGDLICIHELDFHRGELLTHDEYDRVLIEKAVGYAKALQEALKGKRPGDDLVADAFFKLIMVQLNSHFTQSAMMKHTEIMPKLVTETFQYIENHLWEEINLSRLEEELHYNGTYISRCFKRITGITLQQFIIAKKVTLSCKLLREGYAPCDVCYMTGFNNYSNYSRTFSKQMGKSPKKYQMDYRI